MTLHFKTKRTCKRCGNEFAKQKTRKYKRRFVCPKCRDDHSAAIMGVKSEKHLTDNSKYFISQENSKTDFIMFKPDDFIESTLRKYIKDNQEYDKDKM